MIRHFALLIAFTLAAVSAHAASSVSQTDQHVTVKGRHHQVTFDKTRGGAISAINGKAVQQQDHADGYMFTGDVRAKQDAAVTVVIVKGFYVDKDGKRPASLIRAEYQYTFHDDLPVVACRATISQNQITVHADFYRLPSVAQLTVLDFGKRAGFKGPFRAEQMRKVIYFNPGQDNMFDVAGEQRNEFLDKTQPKLPIVKPLLTDKFDDKNQWTVVSGKWRIDDGLLIESSATGRHAWIVAGSDAWRDYVADTQVLSEDGQGIQYLAARWQDPDNHYALVYIEYPISGLRIDRVVNAKRVVLAETGAMPTGTLRNRHRLRFAVRGSQLRAYRGDELLLEVYDTTFGAGRVALGTAADRPVAYDDFHAHGLKPLDVTVPTVTLTEPVGRHGFYREEDSAAVRYSVSTNMAINNVTATLVMRNEKHPAYGDIHLPPVQMGDLKANETRAVAFDINPAHYRSGDYTADITITQDDRVVARDKTTLYLRRKPNPDRMVVNLWDFGDPGRLAPYGFNRNQALSRGTKTEWHGGKPKTPQDPRRLFRPEQDAVRQHYCDVFDEYLKHGMWGYINLVHTTRVVEDDPSTFALKRNGKDLQDRAYGHHAANRPRPNPWHPKYIKLIEDFWRQELAAFKDLPAWQAVLLNSETERMLQVYGNDYWLAMAREELGFDVPADVEDPWGVNPKDHPLPEDGIIESDNPYYRFYRWWHQRGEGQRLLDARVAKVIHEFRPDVKAWHDPALRQPFVRGRLRGMDETLHWFYSWPIPRRAPLVADELKLAAVDGQSPIFQLQLIVWGGIAIHPAKPRWPHVKVDRYLPAHSPAVVRQVSWLAVSRGVSGVSYHGIRTVDRLAMAKADERTQVRGGGYEHYMYSNPDTLDTIKQVSDRLFKPYGMVTRQCAPPRAPIAMLLPTALGVMAHADGMNFRAEEAGRMYAKLQAAHLPVEPVYEIDLEERGLGDYKAVALPGCKVLPRHIYDMLRKFEAAGGVIIADEHLVPKFDDPIVFKWNVKGWDIGKSIQAEILGDAPKVRKALAGKIDRRVDCDSPSIALSTLVDGDNRLLFAVNTLMQAGDYLGPFGSVQDDGVPQTATLKIRKADCVIYDTTARRMVKPKHAGDWLTWPVELGPGEGRMFAILPRAVGNIEITAPRTITKAGAADVDITITDKDGNAPRGLTPLHITIHDSQGMLHDYTDHTVARDGKATVTFPVAVNEPSGAWRVTARELYGFNKSSRYLTVRSKASSQ